jgi:hypothetical protein
MPPNALQAWIIGQLEAHMGRAEGRKTDRDADTPRLAVQHVTAPFFLLGRTIRLLPTADGELRAAEGEQPVSSTAVQRYGSARLANPARRPVPVAHIVAGCFRHSR